LYLVYLVPKTPKNKTAQQPNRPTTKPLNKKTPNNKAAQEQEEKKRRERERNKKVEDRRKNGEQ
jgi:hypothetical protein